MFQSPNLPQTGWHFRSKNTLAINCIDYLEIYSYVFKSLINLFLVFLFGTLIEDSIPLLSGDLYVRSKTESRENNLWVFVGRRGKLRTQGYSRFKQEKSESDHGPPQEHQP